jgi:hypothetical protein
MKPLNDQPFSFHSNNGVVFHSDHCDFRNGITYKIPKDTNKKEIQRMLMVAVAEMIGEHAMNVHPRLNGFQGYDVLTFTHAKPLDPFPTPREKWLIKELEAKGYSVTEIERQSEREFDLKLKGFFKHSSVFSAWLPLFVIRELSNWMMLADMSDYPELVNKGDWSGIRDSSRDAIWKMLHRVCP